MRLSPSSLRAQSSTEPCFSARAKCLAARLCARNLAISSRCAGARRGVLIGARLLISLCARSDLPSCPRDRLYTPSTSISRPIRAAESLTRPPLAADLVLLLLLAR